MMPSSGESIFKEEEGQTLDGHGKITLSQNRVQEPLTLGNTKNKEGTTIGLCQPHEAEARHPTTVIDSPITASQANATPMAKDQKGQRHKDT